MRITDAPLHAPTRMGKIEENQPPKTKNKVVLIKSSASMTCDDILSAIRFDLHIIILEL